MATLVFMATLVGCSESDSVSPASSNGLASTVFESSPHTSERFGSIVARNVVSETDSESQAAVIEAINDFSLNLHRVLVNQTSDDDMISSGYSAAVALTLTYAGTGGNTRTALANMLGFDAVEDVVLFPAMNALAQDLKRRSNEDLVLHTANRMFVRVGLPLQNDFLDIATGDFGAPVVEADFSGATEEVTRVVNAWVAEQTDDFIPTIIQRFPPGTVFAILNTIFLDAGWQDEYVARGERNFTLLDNSVSAVESFGGRATLPILRSNELLALEVPYGGGDLAMLILMPNSLPDFESTLDASTVADIVNTMSTRDIDFTAPGWEDEAVIDLFAALAPLGLPENPWNFDRMIDGGAALEVLARQKARIEVDENGTRAAAVTVVAGIESAAEPVSIDRPFIYMIRDRPSGLILFTGRVVSP